LNQDLRIVTLQSSSQHAEAFGQAGSIPQELIAGLKAMGSVVSMMAMMIHGSHAAYWIMAQSFPVWRPAATPPAPPGPIPKGENEKVTTGSPHRNPRKRLFAPTAYPSLFSAPSPSPSSSPVFEGAARSPTLLPTPMVRRKSSIKRVHLRPPVVSSRISKRLFPLPVSLRTFAHRICCCIFHRLQSLNRCSRVYVLY